MRTGKGDGAKGPGEVGGLAGLTEFGRMAIIARTRPGPGVFKLVLCLHLRKARRQVGRERERDRGSPAPENGASGAVAKPECGGHAGPGVSSLPIPRPAPPSACQTET